MIITIPKEMLGKHCILFCPVCGTNTNHVLGKSGQFYACACGSVVDVEIEESEDENE